MQLSLHLPGTSSAKAALSRRQVRSRAPFHPHLAAGVVQSATCQHHGREGQQEGAGGIGRRATILGMTAGGLLASGDAGAVRSSKEAPPLEIKHSDEEWRKMLSPAAYRVLRQAGTELPLSSPLYREKRPGTYKCAGCGSPLFLSSAKYDSRSGWPSFTEAVDNSVIELLDTSIPFYPRTEVRCKRCGGHIGHVFPDGPPPTGQRYCMNGAALEFERASSTARNGARLPLKL